MWVAIAAVTFTSVARAETGLQRSKTYVHPVLEFLARSQSQNPAAISGVLRFANLGSRRQANILARNTNSSALIAMLSVLLIGPISPLPLVSLAWSECAGRCTDRAPSTPSLFSLFQRPPPIFA